MTGSTNTLPLKGEGSPHPFLRMYIQLMVDGEGEQTDWELTRLTTPYLHSPHEAYWDKTKKKT